MARKGMDFVQREYYDKHLRGTAAVSGHEDRALMLFNYHVKRIQKMCMARRKWLGMPKTIDIRFLELELYRSGLVIFYYDYELKRFLAAKGAQQNRLDMFENPTAFRVFGNSLVKPKTLPAEMVVPIWANDLRTPDHDLVMLWAARIAEFEVTFDVNSKNARRPRVLVYDEETQMSAQNINNLIDQGVPTIEVAVDPTSTGMINSFDLGIDPRMLQELHITRMRLENQMMGELGINNANQDKKERLVSDEVDANNDQVYVSRAVNLNALKFACLKINDKWEGLNVQVEYGSDVVEQEQSKVDASAFAPIDPNAAKGMQS